ncbi:unnamed protein product [Hymenolepis diminuta]|uniref:Ubiquitin-like domain-containing protein n=1 Tax=Hymenolepis diminuta TaxID=6216 RepID=A0A0R3SSK1_HYMDI|nr:unnamed protein product [Hymenolepis diminuta]
MFEVSVKTLDGESKTFQIEDEELTVSGFKEKISSEMNIPIDRQRLIFQGKLLADDRKLKDCDVASKTVHLVPRPPPQPGNEAGPSATNEETQPSRSTFGSSPFQGFTNTMNSIFQSLNPPPSNVNPALSAYRLFNTLQRQANNLLNNIDGERANESTSTIAPVEGQTTISDASNLQSGNFGSTSEQQSQQQETPTVDFERLADMVAEQRRLWQRLDPHLDRWEAMLRAEQEARKTENRSESFSNDEVEPMDTSNDTEPATSTTNVEWSDTFFSNVSAALHLHAHMLHLFSDFLVEQEGHRQRRSTSSRRSSSNIAIQPTTSINQPSPLTGTPSTRSLYIREPNSSILHAHINIEPTVVTIARPLVNVTSSDTEARRRSQSAHPPASNTATSDTTPTSENDTTATTNTSVDANATTTSTGTTNEGRRLFEIPTAVVFDTPLLGGGQSGGNLTAQLLETIYSQLGQAIPINTGSNQTPTTNSGVSSNTNNIPTSPGTARRRSNIRSMASSGMTNLLPPATFPFPPPPPPRNGVDIFLPCGSRHSLGGGRRRNAVPRIGRRRSLVGSVIGSNLRRGHSAGAPQTSRTATDTTTPVASAQSGNQNQSTSSQPIETVRSLMEMASGQLNQILAEFGVTTSATAVAAGSGSVGAASTQSSTAVNSTNSSRNTVSSFAFSPPVLPSDISSNTDREDYRIPQFPEILIEGLIRLVWSAIYRIARAQIPDSSPSLPIDDWERGTSAYLFHAYADDSLIRPIFASVIRHLPPLGDVFNSVTDFLHAVDVARPAIQNVVNENFLMETGSASIVRPELINLLLNSFLTDESNFSFPDGALFKWATSRAAEVGNEPLDIRRSLHNFFQDGLSRQLPLWRVNSTDDGVLGNVLLNSLEVLMIELYAFCHLLVQRGVEALGLQLNSVSVDADPVIATFGHSLSFAPLMSLILHHYDTLMESGAEETAIDLLIHGMDSVRNAFPSSGVTRFNENRERLESYLQTRPLPASTSTNATVDAIETPLQAGSRNSPAIGDDDISDVYMDAIEESPICVQPVNGEAPTDSTTGLFPDWDTQEISRSTAEALAPNPLSTWRSPVSSTNCPPVPDAFPSEWTEVVASDVIQMSASVNASQQENDTSDESTPSVRRLSDAYVAGMPVKRRRVMLERKHDLTNSANDMFMNLLKEAMSSQVPVASPTGPVEIENDGNVVAVFEGGTLSLSQVAPPQHVSEAFRAYVTEQLSRRLANDPDFDAERHSAAGEVFGKRSSSSDKRQ